MNNPEKIPDRNSFDLFVDDKVSESHFDWLCKKLALGQNVCLLGQPGPLRRWLVLELCHHLGREVEYVSLSRDTTSAGTFVVIFEKAS